MSCEIDALWIPGNDQFARDPIKKPDGSADTGLTIRLYVLPAINSLLAASLVDWSLPEVGVTGVYEGSGAAAAIDAVLTAATDYYAVSAGPGYRSEARKIHYGYFDPSLAPA